MKFDCPQKKIKRIIASKPEEYSYVNPNKLNLQENIL